MDSDVRFYAITCTSTCVASIIIVLVVLHLMNRGTISMINALLIADLSQGLLWSIDAALCLAIGRPLGIAAFSLGTAGSLIRARSTWQRRQRHHQRL